ncbi:MAG TPA: ATP synthase F0 subunit C [Bdellovibrionales bacterium]|nr:ATP synthase F0 subunit C [Bdellovibrionales bacterium]
MKAAKTLLLLAATLIAAPAFAQDPAAAPAAAAGAGALGLVAIGIGIMMGLAVLGGTLGQSRAASAALDGIARNPAASDKLFTPMIIALALMESLVLFAFLIGFLLQGPVAAGLAALAH